MEDYVRKCKEDMEFEAMDTIRELREYAEDANIEPDFVLECFVNSFHRHKDDKDIGESITDLVFESESSELVNPFGDSRFGG